MTGITIPICNKKVVDKKTGKFLYEVWFNRVHAQGDKNPRIDVTVNHVTEKDPKKLLAIADNEKDWFVEEYKKLSDDNKKHLQLDRVDLTS